MSAIYFAIPTNAGQAKIANAIALGVPLKITHMAVGDGNGQPVTPNPAQTALVREQRRAPLNTLFQDPLNPAQLVAEQIIPETVGGWWIREVGLFDDSGTLIAIANSPDTYKPQLSEGSGRTQTIRMVLIVSDTSAVELKIDPAVVLATRKYVDDVMKAHKESRDHPAGTQTDKGMLRLATQGEAIAGLLDSVAVAPKEMKAAMEALLDIVAPIGVPIPWVAATPPNSRFLIAQGQSFDKVAYPKLGALWPTGVIPFDMRGEFIRGWDNGRGVDNGRAILSFQGEHVGYIKFTLGTYGGTFTPGQIFVSDDLTILGQNQTGSPFQINNANTPATGDIYVVPDDNRSRNIAFNYIVRAA
ncbi:phage tail protein [Aeromonas caviae]|uniref:phage tail protein n=1 Tax=Aeromonas caviae TaxID=648 RepID=UPI002B253D4B|nr:phage tail protein [Aeromonas caviae]MEA9442262.1 phage tail protein [Aeromonas caviae]